MNNTQNVEHYLQGEYRIFRGLDILRKFNTGDGIFLIKPVPNQHRTAAGIAKPEMERILRKFSGDFINVIMRRIAHDKIIGNGFVNELCHIGIVFGYQVMKNFHCLRMQYVILIQQSNIR